MIGYAHHAPYKVGFDWLDHLAGGAGRRMVVAAF